MKNKTHRITFDFLIQLLDEIWENDQHINYGDDEFQHQYRSVDDLHAYYAFEYHDENMIRDALDILVGKGFLDKNDENKYKIISGKSLSSMKKELSIKKEQILEIL